MTQKTLSPYKKLETIFKKLTILDEISNLIHWDIEVMMPPSALSMHIDKLQFLAKIRSEIIKNPKIYDLIGNAKSETLDKWQEANLQLMEKNYNLAQAIPIKLEQKFIKASTHCNAVWREARPNNDFKSFAAAFKPMLQLTREMAQIRGEVLKMKPYDALIDQYDPGRKSYEIDAFFSAIQGKIQDLVQSRIESQSPKPDLRGHYPEDIQKALGSECMHDLGFDFDRGRLDISTHPFCSGSMDDIRITTRYNTSDFLQSLMGVLHETGHAIYEMNLPKKWSNQPVGSALGMAIHESQSHFVEMQLVPTKEFMVYLQQKLNKHFPEHADKFTTDALLGNVTHVERSLIRVEADELTYPLHIMLRYQLEKLLISDQLQVDDLPQAWNERMQRLLGVTPTDNKDGCMQDVHWPSGAFGYFPSYTLGSMTAAQLASKCRSDIANYSEQVSVGHFQEIFSWLKNKVHQHGSRFTTADNLLLHATGERLNPQHYLDYLQNKYGN